MSDPWVVWAPINGGPELKPIQQYEPANHHKAVEHAAQVGGFVVQRPNLTREKR